MRMRVVTAGLLTAILASCTFAVASEQRKARSIDPLALQPAVAWPPKAVPNPAEGKVPDFTERNEDCLDCHGEILDVKTARPNLMNPHVLHLDSKKIAYEGDNRLCVTCHEMITLADGKAPPKEGWFSEGDIYHPNVGRFPGGYWKKTIVRTRAAVQPPFEALRPSEPHLFKPTLKRLVCVECHGPDSKIKTLYGAPEAGATK